MKKYLFIAILVSIVYSMNSQDRDFDKLSYGFQINRFHNEFGIGIHTLSPEFMNLRIDLRANINWLDHIDATNNHTWSEFGSAQLGINHHTFISSRISLYSEGGIITLFPNSEFSSSNVEFGGYGVFGFEFYITKETNRNPSYFIELGGIGTGATADKVSSEPKYANGFLMAVGYRF